MENGTDIRCYAFHWGYTREDTGGIIDDDEPSSEDACVFGNTFDHCFHDTVGLHPFLEPQPEAPVLSVHTDNLVIVPWSSLFDRWADVFPPVLGGHNDAASHGILL